MTSESRGGRPPLPRVLRRRAATSGPLNTPKSTTAARLSSGSIAALIASYRFERSKAPLSRHLRLHDPADAVNPLRQLGVKGFSRCPADVLRFLGLRLRAANAKRGNWTARGPQIMQTSYVRLIATVSKRPLPPPVLRVAAYPSRLLSTISRGQLLVRKGLSSWCSNF